MSGLARLGALLLSTTRPLYNSGYLRTLCFGLVYDILHAGR